MYLLNLWFLPSASHVKHLWEFRLPLHISIRLLSSIKKLHILTSISSFKVILLMSCWQRGSNFSPFGFFLDLFGGLIPLPLGLFIEISNFSIIFGEHFLLLHLLNVVLKCPRLIIFNSHIFVLFLWKVSFWASFPNTTFTSGRDSSNHNHKH